MRGTLFAAHGLAVFLISMLALSAVASVMKDHQRPSHESELEDCKDGSLEKAAPVYMPTPPGGVIRGLCEDWAGAPVIAYVVNAAGRVESVRFLRSSGCDRADEELERCALEWIFDPAKCSGKPIRKERYFNINWGYGPAPAEAGDYCVPYEEFRKRSKEPTGQSEVESERAVGDQRSASGWCILYSAKQ